MEQNLIMHLKITLKTANIEFRHTIQHNSNLSLFKDFPLYLDKNTRSKWGLEKLKEQGGLKSDLIVRIVSLQCLGICLIANMKNTPTVKPVQKDHCICL